MNYSKSYYSTVVEVVNYLAVFGKKNRGDEAVLKLIELG